MSSTRSAARGGARRRGTTRPARKRAARRALGGRRSRARRGSRVRGGQAGGPRAPDPAGRPRSTAMTAIASRRCSASGASSSGDELLVVADAWPGSAACRSACGRTARWAGAGPSMRVRLADGDRLDPAGAIDQQADAPVVSSRLIAAISRARSWVRIDAAGCGGGRAVRAGASRAGERPSRLPCSVGIFLDLRRGTDPHPQEEVYNPHRTVTVSGGGRYARPAEDDRR